jgi:hypothetical protein
MENNSGATQQDFFWEIYKWQREHHPDLYKQGDKQ